LPVLICFNGEYRVLASSWPYIGQSDWHQAGDMVRRTTPKIAARIRGFKI
jgi:hypothetical protein